MSDEGHTLSLRINDTNKVEFPELGMELVSGHGQSDKNDSGSFSVNVPDTSWHHNWLFRQQLHLETQLGSARMCPPVSMLVPNPLTMTKTQIGNTDVDLVSELSERVSVLSFEMSSGESDVILGDNSDDISEHLHNDNDNDDHNEADQEYTIYEQLPVRRSYTSSQENEIVNENLHSASIDNKKSSELKSNKNIDLKWISGWDDVISTHEGKIVSLMCQVSGSKPIGKIAPRTVLMHYLV